MTDRESFGIDGKVAIVVVGGSRAEGIGTGRAAAILLARAGARVVVADFNLANAEATVEMISGEGGEASAHQTDATDSDSCCEMVAAAVERYGRLDILDNNVGIGSRGSVVEESEAVWSGLVPMRAGVRKSSRPGRRTLWSWRPARTSS